MGKYLDELLWVRTCTSEVLGGVVVGTVVGACLEFGRVAPLISHGLSAIIGVVVFTLLVGERLTRTPEE